MTKREFVKLKKGDILLAIRHLLNEHGEVIINENSEWRVEKIEYHPTTGPGKKSIQSVKMINLDNGKKHSITKENSTNFLIYRRKRGPVPKEEIE
jgi:hypothetical protein